MVYKKKDTVASAIFRGIWIFLISCIFFSCGENKTTMKEMEVYQGPIMDVDSLEMLYSDSSILRIRFTAGKQLELQNGNKEFLKGVRVEFYNEKGVSEAVLTSEKGYQDKLSSIYKVEGDVVVQNLAEKKALHTEKLFWDSKNKKIYTSEFVKIETPTEILTGQGLEAAQDFSRYKILKPTGIFVIE